MKCFYITPTLTYHVRLAVWLADDGEIMDIRVLKHRDSLEWAGGNLLRLMNEEALADIRACIAMAC